MTDTIPMLAEHFERVARNYGWWISPDGRIGVTDVERLLGWQPGTFDRRRRDGQAPPAYRIGGGGHRLTVVLTDLAEWFLAQRIETDTE